MRWSSAHPVFSHAGHSAKLPRGDRTSRGETRGLELRLLPPRRRCHHHHLGSTGTAGSHAARHTGLGERARHTAQGQVSWGAGGTPACATLEGGCKRQRRWAAFIESGSCQPEQLVPHGECGLRPITFPFFSLPPSFPLTPFQERKLPPGPTAFSLFLSP